MNREQCCHPIQRHTIVPDRLLLVAQPDSYRIAPYIRAAQQMNMEVLIASKGEYSLTTEVHAGLHIDLDRPDAALAAILREAGSKPFSGILGSDDSTVELAARAAAKLGLPHNPPAAARISRRKDLARACLLGAGCAVPWYDLVDLRLPPDPQMMNTGYPCVLKPLHLAASRGVIRADSETEFVQAAQRIHAIIRGTTTDPFEQNHILVEDYIDGDEVAFEGFLQNGKLTPFAIFDKPQPLVGPYFEETVYITPSILTREKQELVRLRVQQACNAYGLTTGAVHAELRINDDDAWILEVASRTIGGDCGRVFDSGQGFDIETATIALATGRQPNIQTPDGVRGVMMLPVPGRGLLKRVDGVAAARRVEHVQAVEIVIPEGHELVPLPEGNQYPGYIFARASTRRDTLFALQDAYSKLTFRLSPVWGIT